MTGVISSFDEVRGDGLFITDEGETLYFHCVAIKNGTRVIDVGVRASATRVVGHQGRDEASDIEAIA